MLIPADELRGWAFIDDNSNEATERMELAIKSAEIELFKMTNVAIFKREIVFAYHYANTIQLKVKNLLNIDSVVDENDNALNYKHLQEGFIYDIEFNYSQFLKIRAFFGYENLIDIPNDAVNAVLDLAAKKFDNPNASIIGKGMKDSEGLGSVFSYVKRNEQV